MDNGKFEGLALVCMDEEKLTGIQNVFKNCMIKCEIETNQRMYLNGEEQAMSKLKFEIDLSAMKHPWQPHMDQPCSIAEEFLSLLMESYADQVENDD